MTENNEIAVMVAEQLERLLVAEVTPERIAAVEAGEADAALWDQCEDMGLPLALASEASGGVGLAWGDLNNVFRTLGRHATPSPVGESMVANYLLSASGIALPGGPIAVLESVFTMRSDGTLLGEEKMVPWLPGCDYAMLVAERAGERRVCLVQSKELQCTPVQCLSREPHADVSCDGILPVASAAAPDWMDDNGARPFLAVLRSAQIAGAMERLLDLTVDYANQREQFGRPIGKFQAIQHAIAQLTAEAAVCQAASACGCRFIDAGNPGYGAEVAKARSGRAAGVGSEIGHQVFGAIGFTDEHMLHYFTRRLWQWRADAGSEYWWAEQLGRRAFAAGGDGLWSMITA